MYDYFMIPDFYQSPAPVSNLGVLKTIVGLFFVIFATFVGVEIRLSKDDDD